MTSGPFPLGVPLEPYYQDELVTLYHEDCLDALRQLPDASVDSVVTDPPYGLEFMGKDWDSFKGEAWRTGAGMSKTGLGERPTQWVSYGRGDSANATCAVCGGRMRGAKQHPTSDSSPHDPEWRVKGKPLSERNNDAAQMRAFGRWCELWAAECLRVLKPGGHLLAFGGTRTWHRLAVAIEDAGFEIRDSIAWMYGSGFPKSLDVSKAIDKAAGAERDRVPFSGGIAPGQRNYGGSTSVTVLNGTKQSDAPATPDAARWQGWGTALKPAHEPVVVARKPLTGTVAANVLEHGTGALNIDGCRIGTDGGGTVCTNRDSLGKCRGHDNAGRSTSGPTVHGPNSTAGRWPANVVLDEDQAAALDGQSGYQKDGVATNRNRAHRKPSTVGYTPSHVDPVDVTYGGGGGASRFFYVAKAPARERPKVDGVAHPTVKPLTLMRWLCRLVTPPGGIVLEPFAGSGTTVEAALLEGFRVVAIEREPDYLPLIAARLERIGQEPDGQLTFDASA